MRIITKRNANKIVELIIANSKIAHDLYSNENVVELLDDIDKFIENSTEISRIATGYPGAMRYLNTMEVFYS